MATKLIATEFDYTWRGRRDGEVKTFHGSYLGRKVASVRTLRRFINGTIRRTGADMVLQSVTVGGNYVSQWVAK